MANTIKCFTLKEQPLFGYIVKVSDTFFLENLQIFLDNMKCTRKLLIFFPSPFLSLQFQLLHICSINRKHRTGSLIFIIPESELLDSSTKDLRMPQGIWDYTIKL